MKKRERRDREIIDRENIAHRGNSRDLFRKYQLEMDVVHKVAPSYYTEEGELKRTGTRRKKS